ncbi:MAG TPA: hypothetical protein VJ832_13725 [Variovorax sp.]|jgi:hypothetical protein|nr:hypothetical protein [Variovorax sp.]
MSTKAARREYLQAVAEFNLACQEFSRGMDRVLQSAPSPAAERLFGPRKAARRAPRAARVVERARKA